VQTVQASPARGLSAQILRGPATGLIVQVLLLVALAATAGIGVAGWVVGAACAVVTSAALARGLVHFRSGGFGPADWVTLARGSLAVGVAALVAASFEHPAHVALLVTLAVVALVLDRVDGSVVRRTGTASPLGGHFDGEVDAFLILVLSVYVARSQGAWVLAIGAARYAFLAAGWLLPWMRAQLPPRYWRKVVAATQGIVLTVAAAGVLPRALSQTGVAVALALLAESFGRDTQWLWRHRRAPAAATQRGRAHAAAAHAGARRGRVRRSIAAVLTVIALLIVWIALVAPDELNRLTPSAFARIPLEGLVLVALALVLPAAPRRLLACIVGPVLGALVIVKVLDMGFFETFDRPFDPISDGSNIGIGIETLRDSIGRTEANLLVAGALVLVVILFVLTTLSVLRLTKVTASHRRWSLPGVAALGVVWGICWLFGAQFVAHAPLASTSAAGLVSREIRAVRAGIDDPRVFGDQIRHDRYASTPADQLVGSLRGKDVILAFVESYGQVATQDSAIAAQDDAVVNQGTKTLKAAGFSAKSAFVTSSTFGGLSWLAHSTLQAGVWVDSQQRYDQLVKTNRLTLSDAFKRAGWRTVSDVPSDDRAWPEGTSFYHYDKLYDRRNVGYRGPKFSYASMPDQYVWAALQRLELSKPDRRNIFAEVDLVSSHTPWTRIPTMIPWREVGNGSIYKGMPAGDLTRGELFSDHAKTQAAYGTSIRYTMSALVSFVQHYGKKNLVLIVLGDHQPAKVVSGENPTHNAPISIIAHDPKVLDKISGWDWQNGLLPSPKAPVWRMDAFRSRFFSAFGS
jgi:phosphatidylglycerophosphate synthase